MSESEKKELKMFLINLYIYIYNMTGIKGPTLILRSHGNKESHALPMWLDATWS